MTGKLDGKVALVTGSGRGIGREIALKFASEGASIVVNDMDESPANDVVNEIVSLGGRAVACIGSVCEDTFPGRFVGAAVDHFNGIDIIVNNAGYTWDSVIQKMTDEQWDSILDVHLKAPFRILREAQPFISERIKEERKTDTLNVRKIINISSLAGLYGNAGQVNYSAAKMGVVGMTKALSKEWGRYNTTVNCVAFGFIETRLTESIKDVANTIVVESGREIKVGVQGDMKEMVKAITPLGRGGTPAEAAGSVYLFAIPESDYVSGQVLVCGGGLII